MKNSYAAATSELKAKPGIKNYCTLFEYSALDPKYRSLYFTAKLHYTKDNHFWKPKKLLVCRGTSQDSTSARFLPKV